MNIFSGKWWRLRRLCAENGRFKVLATFQTGPFVSPIKQKRGLDVAQVSDVSAVKGKLAEYLTPNICRSGGTGSRVCQRHRLNPATAELILSSKGAT